MTKFKTYKYGPHFLKTYFKPVGHGYEVGLVCKGKSYFVGNFIHKNEAMKWWGFFNKEVTAFAKKYWVSDDVSFSWYCSFLSKYLYRSYYSFLDKLFTKYNRNFIHAVSKDVRKYNKMKKHFDPSEKFHFHGKAA